MLLTIRQVCILFVALFGLGISVYGQQLNEDKITATVMQGEQWADVFTSTEFLKIIVEHSNGNESAESGGGNDDIHFAKFIPDPGFEGTQELVVEYVDYLGQKWYTEVTIHVVKSRLVASDDFLWIAQGDASGTVEVLSNDYSSTGNYQLLELGLVRNGTAVIQSNGLIEFTPDEGFSGIASFHYTIRDDVGTSCVGKVIVNVAGDGIISDTSYFTLVNTSIQSIFLPNQNFSLSPDYTLVHGTVNEVSAFSFEYQPGNFAEGVEFFKFVDDSGNEQYVEIELINNQDAIDFVVDDKLYTNVEQYIGFDARENDYSSEGLIVDYSPELIHTSGSFAYHPPAGFSGVKNFYYIVHDGYSTHRGEIQIFVGDYLPQKTSYTLSTKRNTPLVLEYQVPIYYFTFNIISQPANGVLLVNQSSYGEADQCGIAEGKELVIYRPNEEFVGSDQFTIEYCTNKGSCREIEIFMTVESSSENCNCYGPDCVWSGDANNDGKVALTDLLPIGYHFGESGEVRTEDGVDWGAKHADDWAFGQQDSESNRKYVDSNGDGIINASDTLALAQNYETYHNLVSQDILVVKDFPIQFGLTEISAQAGDLITFDISLGTDEFPVLDLQGLAFTLQFPSNLIDTGSIRFAFEPDSWFGYGSPSLQMIRTTNNRGRLDAAIVRTDGTGISGKGKIGSTSLTILEDLDGLRPEGETIPIDVIIPESVVTDGSGQLYKVEANRLRINIDISGMNNDDQSPPAEVIAYPNPSNGSFNLHANNQDLIREVKIFNTLGEMVYEDTDINQRNYEVKSSFAQGFYVSHVTTNKGTAVEKIQVIRK